MTVDATPPPQPPHPPPPHLPPPELPPGLVAEYLESARAQLGVLAGLAERLVVAANDRQVIDALRRETHKVHGSAGSYGFMEASRLAAGMEATVKDWAARPDELDVERGSLARWFVKRLAELLGLEVPDASAAPPVRAPAAGRPAAPPGTATPDATPRGAARARRPSRVDPEARRVLRRGIGRRRAGAGGYLRGGRRGARRAARIRAARARVPVLGVS